MNSDKVLVANPFSVMSTLATTTVLVGTELNGKANFMMIAWCCPATHTPASLLICAGSKHASNAGIKLHKAFSINVPSRAVVAKADYCGMKSGADTDKSQVWTVFEGKTAHAPMIKECPVTIECTLSHVFPLDTHEIFVGKIEQVHANPDCIDANAGGISTAKVDPCLFSFSGPSYFQLGERFATPWSVGATAFSAAASAPPPQQRPYPHVDKDLCLGCGACNSACVASPSLWSLGDDGKARFDEKRVDECVRCGHCAEGCPATAIKMTN
eukprot:TRINITY_DN181_c0_g1_i6.p1 TRINITY_DN181_c0_g1~~TRINITY_DN181_c0_g1_i6.p1  ORF type:complete len:293 (-),score=99.01 TRINITY_DN181_c0_g1_i6:63-872(-)